MELSYFYDLECYGALFMGVFIPLNAPQHLIDEYIYVDVYEKNSDVKFHRKVELLTAMNARRYVIYYDVNNLKELYAFLNTDGLTLFGFNNSRYDDVLLAYLLANYRRLSIETTLDITSTLKEASDAIIDVGRNYFRLEPSLFKFKIPFKSYDILNSLFETVERKPLKQFAILLRWYRIQDLPLPPDAVIPKGKLETISDYCVNDVLITRAILNFRRVEFKNKFDYSKTYGLDLTNKNRSSIADALLAKFYSDATGQTYYEYKDKRTYRSRIKFAELIDTKVKFSTPELLAFYDKLYNTNFIVGADTFSEEVILGGCKYQLGVGGIHSVDMPGYFESTDTEILIDVDADSYYPITVIQLKVAPAHLQQQVFTMIADMVVTDRIKAKHEGNSTVAGSLKIVANSGLFGKFGYENGWLYDLFCLYQTTINCQLRILKLIELFYLNNIKVISANTDGVTCKVKIEQLELYHEICDRWRNMFGYGVEFAEYGKYVRLSVNDYLATYRDKPNKEPKRKGDFRVEIDLTKGYGCPIVSKAINAYYLNGTPIEHSIQNKDGLYDIYDYCLTQNISKSYKPELHYAGVDDNGIPTRIIEEVQHTVRYFASTKGAILMKREKENGVDKKTGKARAPKLISVIAKQYITVFNTYFPVANFEDYNIDYRYYISTAMGMINNIRGITTKQIAKHGGTLFD